MLDSHFDEEGQEELKEMIFKFCCLSDTQVDLNRILVMNEVVQYQPQIISKHRNTSEGMEDVMQNRNFRTSSVVLQNSSEEE